MGRLGGRGDGFQWDTVSGSFFRETEKELRGRERDKKNSWEENRVRKRRREAGRLWEEVGEGKEERRKKPRGGNKSFQFIHQLFL